MLLKYFYDKRLAQASYLLGCQATGEALVVDPTRDVRPYLEAAQEEDLRITHVTETHIHADYVSGSRELAAATGADLYLSDMGDANWKYGFADAQTTLLHDGDTWKVGNVRVEVLHTPGHTPEHICFMITDTTSADRPIGIFTGDFLFVGDVGRPDLLEEAAGQVGTKEIGARQQFQSIQRIKTLPDYLQVWVGHGAGSACGKSLGAIPSTTLGYEKLFNPAFQFSNEDEFVAWLLEGQPEAPRYFAQMKYINRVGAPLLRDLKPPPKLDRVAFEQVIAAGYLVVDLRNADSFARAHRRGTVNIPANSLTFTTHIGWLVDFTKPFYFIMPSDIELEEILTALRAIGVDSIGGYFTAEVLQNADESLPSITAAHLADRLKQDNVLILDVRGTTEYQEKHIAGAKNIPLGYLPEHLAELPHDRPIVTHCASGYRSQIAASLLMRAGFTNVINLNDRQENWSKLLPTEKAR